MFKRQVNLVESERGWGQKVFDEEYFDTDAEANRFIADYNRNSMGQNTVPDYYTYAELDPVVEVS